MSNDRANELRHKTVWRLEGLYLEDSSTDRFTLGELEAWRAWSAWALRGRHGTVDLYVVAEVGGQDVARQDWSDYFDDVCMEVKRPFDFEAAVRDCREYVKGFRERQAGRQ